MREILFRGISKEEVHTHHEMIEEGEMVEGHLSFRDEIMVKMSEEHGGFGPGFVHVRVPVIPETVGQYTGLKDKNGNKIFEGDILTRLKYSSNFIVEFNKEDAIYELRRIYDRYPVSFFELRASDEKVETIGNIHQHKHLMK